MIKTPQADEILSVSGATARVSLDCGFLEFTVTDGGREIDMLHRAPWVMAHEDIDPAIAPHLRGLRGDFFCAPFADASRDSAPMHGATANGQWRALSSEADGEGLTGRWTLSGKALGADVVKEIGLNAGHPFVYQRHVLSGGTGRWPVANHAMLAVPEGAVIRTSPKRIWESPDSPQESDPARGRSHLAYPFRTADPTCFGAADGTRIDLLTCPLSSAHEDFVIAVDAPGVRLGWVAVVRPATGDLYLSLKDARALPLTMFWHSNGGRHYAPWNGRHLGVLGVEEGVGFDAGFLSDDTRAAMKADGQPLALALFPDQAAEVRHVLGQIAWPTGEPVAKVTKRGNSLTVEGESGATRNLPILAEFLPDTD